MIIGLDIDGTITAKPEAFARLSRRVKDEGGEVHVISSRSPMSEHETRLELKCLGIVFDELYLLPNFGSRLIRGPDHLDWYSKYLWQKVEYAINNNIEEMHDDDQRVVALFQSYAVRIRLNPPF